MPYMVTFTINLPQMLAYIPAPWILWVMVSQGFLRWRFSGVFVVSQRVLVCCVWCLRGTSMVYWLCLSVLVFQWPNGLESLAVSLMAVVLLGRLGVLEHRFFKFLSVKSAIFQGYLFYGASLMS